MADGKREEAGQSKPDAPSKPGEARPVDQETQKEASEEREKEGGYD